MGAFRFKAISQYKPIFCAKTLSAHVETFAVNNDISYIRIHCGKPYIYGIEVGCNFFWDTLYFDLGLRRSEIFFHSEGCLIRKIR